MRFAKMFSALFAFILAFALAMPEAATVKRPLTPKMYGKQFMLEWTGTASLPTADDGVFLADTATANMYGVDPLYFLYKKKVSVGEEMVYPAEKPMEKLCVAVTSTSDADGTVADVYLQASATKDGTFVKVGETAQTITTTAATAVIMQAAIPMVPYLFWKLVIDPTSATDQMDLTGVRIWPCDD